MSITTPQGMKRFPFVLVFILAISAIALTSVPAFGMNTPSIHQAVGQQAEIGEAPAASQVEGCKPKSDKVPQLMYHMIKVPSADAGYPHLWVNPTVFRKTMKKLYNNGWRTLNPRTVAWRIKHCHWIPAKTFTIIIDDGDRNGYDNAFPILQEFGFTAAFAVVVGRIDVKAKSLTWDMLTQLQDAGNEIANHTMDHDDLRAEDADGLFYEIEASNRILTEHLGKQPRTFVYPYGYFDGDAVKRVKASQFWVAFTTYYGCTYTHADRFLEERVRINRADNPSEVLDKVQDCVR